MTCVSHSEEETKKIGRKIAKELKKGDVVGLYGELGSGKTVLTKGIASGLKSKIQVKSPSFTIINEYRGEHTIYHIDLYRIDKKDDLLKLGFDDYFYGDGVCVIEWAEKISDYLPPKGFDIHINILDETTREIKVVPRNQFHMDPIQYAYSRD
jgi:tRNA threonylcarbamoyladenosine biosynthesis protein TsaE